jgi:hypothetical protein
MRPMPVFGSIVLELPRYAAPRLKPSESFNRLVVQTKGIHGPHGWLARFRVA